MVISMSEGALLFPGQGVQYLGMGKQLYDSYPIVQHIFEEASDSCGIDLKQLCFGKKNEELNLTENTQPAVLTVGYAASKVLESEYDFIPICGAGHSLGEITALTTAGAIPFASAVKLVKVRGRLMQEAVAKEIGAMSAIIGLNPSLVKQTCEELTRDGAVVEVSNYNTNTQTVISGHKEAVEMAEQRFLQLHAKVVRLKVSAPFHCSLMQSAAIQLEKELDQIAFQKLRYPVLSNVTGSFYINEEKIKDLLVLQMTKPDNGQKYPLS